MDSSHAPWTVGASMAGERRHARAGELSAPFASAAPAGTLERAVAARQARVGSLLSRARRYDSVRTLRRRAARHRSYRERVGTAEALAAAAHGWRHRLSVAI